MDLFYVFVQMVTAVAALAVCYLVGAAIFRGKPDAGQKDTQGGNQ